MWRQVLHILEHWGCHRDLQHDIPLRWIQLCVILQLSAVVQVGECPNPGFLLKVFSMAFSWGDFWTAFQRACAMHLPGDCQWWNLAGFDDRSPCGENELLCLRCVIEDVLQEAGVGSCARVARLVKVARQRWRWWRIASAQTWRVLGLLAWNLRWSLEIAALQHVRNWRDGVWVLTSQRSLTWNL